MILIFDYSLHKINPVRYKKTIIKTFLKYSNNSGEIKGITTIFKTICGIEIFLKIFISLPYLFQIIRQLGGRLEIGNSL